MVSRPPRARVQAGGRARSIEPVMPRGAGELTRKRNEPGSLSLTIGMETAYYPRVPSGVGRAQASKQFAGHRPRASGTSPTDVAGDVARQEKIQPRGKSSPFNSVRACGATCCAHMEHASACCCCLADAAVQPRARHVGATLTDLFDDSGEVSSCVLLSLFTYTCLMSSPGGMKRGLYATRTVTVGWETS